MTRIAYKYDLEEFIEMHQVAFQGIVSHNVKLYIDEEIEEEVANFLADNGGKFKMIVFEILQNRYKNSLYQQVMKGISEMRFATGKTLNARLYCKEHFLADGKKIVIAHYLDRKKSQKIGKKIKKTLERIGGYIYEYKER